MMPFIQGDSSSLPKEYLSYSHIIDENFLEIGEIGFLTIDESFVKGGKSQRGYNSKGINRNVHIEVGWHGDVSCWGGGGGVPTWGSSPKPKWGGSYPSWGGSPRTTLEEDTMVLIANSISDTCKVWDTIDKSYTNDGDLSEYIDRYPEDSGILLKDGELAKISIFTPHECITQLESSERQFFRIVGKGVKGREEHFTINPKVKL